MLKDTQRQKQFRILLIGETCLDVYNTGVVERISPEAPVPVLKKTRSKTKLGMAGNVLQNIKSMLPDSEIDVFSNDPEKIQKIRFLDENSKYQIMRYDIEDSIDPIKISDIDLKIKYDAIVISDYNKGFLKDSFVKSLVYNYPSSKIFVDSKKKSLSAYSGCTIKINEVESRSINEEEKNSLDIITTLGPKGCSYKGKRYKSKKVEVYDVCGAGDVFLSALVVRWLQTKEMEESIRVANTCAGISVTKLGCYTISRKEYKESLR